MNKMTRITLVISSLTLLVLLFGCSERNRPTVSLFEVGVDELTDIQVDKSFVINGYLKNNSNSSVTISHGAGLFTYEIVDEEGKPIPKENGMLVVNDIGFGHELKPDEVYRNNGEGQRSNKFYTFVIHKPGHYRVTAIAKFSDANTDTGTRKEPTSISSEPLEFIVE